MIDMDALLAFGTIVLAAATCALAYFTRKSSRDAADALEISASQLIETGKAAQLAAAIEVTREYREERLRKARVLIRSLPERTPGDRLIDLDAEQQDAAFAVSHYLDNLGALVVHDLLTPDAARTFLGSSAIEMWKILAPYIYAERERTGFRIYQIHFEHLAWVMDSIDIEAEMLERFRGELMPPVGWRAD
jgi:hypothetical protein